MNKYFILLTVKSVEVVTQQSDITSKSIWNRGIRAKSDYIYSNYFHFTRLLSLHKKHIKQLIPYYAWEYVWEI